MRRRTLLKANTSGGGVEPSLSAAADVCLYEKSSETLIIVPGTQFSASAYPKEKYSPVGVVVVPGSHDVYGDGSCGVMSIKAMNCSSASTGSNTEQYMYWGVYRNRY